jgi:diguanylate cyclase (GGDEF)-like protein/PAS domain S-box-containing protein
VLQGTYNHWLVALSVAMSLVAAYSALDLAGRITAARHWTRGFWLCGGATAMGFGIWSMHYIGMLAFALPVPVFYHYPTVVLSLLAAVAASAVALVTVSRDAMSFRQQAIGGVVMGGGIAIMHYTGMAAMRLPAMMEYHWDRVLLSVVLAVVISLVALLLVFRLRQEERTSVRKIGSALLMGAAIPLMHYTGIWAVTFRASATSFSTRDALHISALGIGVISTTTLAVLTMAIGTAFMDRILSTQRKALATVQQNLSHFRGLADAMQEIIFTSTPDGAVDYCNHRWYEFSGLSEEDTLGRGWTRTIHPDDLPVCVRNWEDSLKSGATLETEYRLLNAQGIYRWHLVRATAVHDSSGAIIKWFGSCNDIEDQKHHQQILEDQIRDRTEELAAANTRLQEEMWERDLARKELDAQNERMVCELTERSERATLLAQMGEVLQSCITRDEAFAAALGFAPKIFPETRGAVALLNPSRNLVEVTSSWAECQLSAFVFEPSACWALRTGHAHLVMAGDLTAPCAHAAGIRNTYLCIPILAQGEAIGILHFQTTDETPTIAAAELSFKTTFAGQLGLSIANIRLRQALHTQSVKDPLTGLYNRRYLEEMLEREIRRAVRAEQSLGILMLDLDHFKKFNDTYGHEAGDAVLKAAGALLVGSIRAEDIVCRFGGEEFVVILPTANLPSACMRAEKICSKMRELNVLHQGQSVGTITASIGVAALPTHGASGKELLAAADAALYRAKGAGRNRVVAAEQPSGEEKEESAMAATQP